MYVTAGNTSGYSFLGGNLNLQSGLGDVSGHLVDEVTALWNHPFY